MLVHAILKELQSNNNITIRNDARIEKVILEQDGLSYGKVQLASGEDFSAELLVTIDSLSNPFINIRYLYIMCLDVDFH